MQKTTIFILVACILGAASAAPKIDQKLFVQDALIAPRETFDTWVTLVKKVYHSVEEYERRFEVWLDNLKFVQDYNSKHTSHQLGMTHFADLTHEEWKSKVLGYRPEMKRTQLKKTPSPFHYDATVLPKEIDWRIKGAVGPVKNQQLCGSCWAFSTTGSIEGINAIVTGEFKSISEQQLVDCDTTQDNGCHGGLMDYAFEFIIQNGGVDTEEDYPYLGEDATCDPGRNGRHVVTIDGYEDVPPNDEVALKKAVANQPVSVAIEADQRAFQLYVSGVFDDVECGTSLNHGVVIVGYGVDFNGTHHLPHWLVRNSWGEEWGDGGYIKLRRDIIAAEGQCGIAMQASYPIKKGPNPPEPPPSPPAPPPAPPGPQPVDCDGTVQCPADSTCCCMRDFFGFCFTWACCPLPEATCCEDHEHCCPSDLPVCDTDEGTCSAGGDGPYKGVTIPMVKKQPAMRKERPWWGPFRNPRDEDSLKAQGRLLAQLAETPIGTAPADIVLITPAEVNPINAPPGSRPGLLTSNKKWIYIGLGSLCGVLVSILIAQWLTETAAWRRQKRKLAQDEACRHHIEQYAADIESPGKSPQLSAFKEGESTAPSGEIGSGEQHTENAATAHGSTTSTNTTTKSSGVRLPPSVILRRAPSLRSNLTSIAVRRSSSSREGTPRSPLSGRLGLGLAPSSSPSLRRSNSSRNPSSMGGSPRSLESKELTVDVSVKARDVRAFGWAPHNHCHQSTPTTTSNPGTPVTSGSPIETYTLSPGRLIHHTEFDGNTKQSLLVHMETDIGLADFKLTTSVAEDEVEEQQQQQDNDTTKEGRIQLLRSSSTSSSTGGYHTFGTGPSNLFSAKSIKPKDVLDATSNNQSEIAAAVPTATPPTPKIISPRTLALTGANVTVLSTADFTFQVQLTRLLGAGGAGCVHEGLWNGWPVAVKSLHPSRQTSASAIEAFRREVEVMARVGPHPGVVAVLATCLSPPNLAIVMELAEQGSLHAVLHEKGSRPRYGTLLALAEDIACAIAHCHSLKLVHRDLKAHNVLLDSAGRAKIADFGLAAAKNRTFLTVEPGALGTASTMAPEQFAAFEVSERCDSYAYGCLLWSMITGQQPWSECSNILQIVMAVGCQRRRPPIPSGCPPQLARLIRECWRHNPALRPGFAEIIDRIRQMKKDDGAAEAFGAASMTAAAFEGDEGKKPRPPLTEYTAPLSSSTTSFTRPGGKSGLSRLAISSS